MSKHAPEPWSLERWPDSDKWTVVCKHGEYEVCEVFGKDNATLICAAPDLLEAAEWCVALCKEIGATETNAYAQARAAIAKATGEA